MAEYCSQQGTVLVIRYPVVQTASSGPLPPIEITPAPVGQSATSDIAYVVYEPYAV